MRDGRKPRPSYGPVRTLLLSMPFGAIDRPALGVSLLKAALLARDLPCELAYPFELLVRRIGLTDYKWLTDTVPYTAFAGDWCFTLPLYGRRPDEDWAYVDEVLRKTWGMSPPDIKRVLRVREATPAFLDDCLAAFDWSAFEVVGFTSTFVQNIASLALARRLKDLHPHLTIVFGGANWEGPMGRALFDSFSFVDHVCEGEADDSFPALVAALSRGERRPTVPGVLSRGAGAPSARPVVDLDRLPYPDFGDFFAMHRRTAPGETPLLLMETSRGCWWGAKNHCTFCGLNGNGIAFRSKSGDRAHAELLFLSKRHDVEVVSMVDNILDMRYFDSLLPALAANDQGPALFYETKANLTRSQVALLAQANVFTIQPGIESLSDGILKLMRKGTTGLRNVQLLKWCCELGVCVEWNILYGFPGETDADYAAMLAWLPLLAHLQPPSGIGPVRIDRFSPYFETPEAFGLTNLRPLQVYRFIYPVAPEVLAGIACYFDAEYIASRASSETCAALIDAVHRWRSNAGSVLTVRDDGAALHISDTRGERSVGYRLHGPERWIYRLCDGVTSLDGVVKGLEQLSGVGYPAAHVEAFLGRLVDCGLLLEDGGRYLSLGIYSSVPAVVAHERTLA
jgi:ribosomal peptide maturation radical SAM protein 1